MDDPQLDAELHLAALTGLESINRISRSVKAIWRPIADLGLTPLTVLDVATGAGDGPIGLYQLARRHGVALQVHGCDRSPRALQHARAQARLIGAPIEFFRHDVTCDPLPGDYDIVMCSLFLHHLSDPEAEALLGQMARAARHLLIVTDLRRGALAWLMTHVGVRLLTNSPVVHVDGPRSVRAAFTGCEAEALARRAGLEAVVVRSCWPLRYLLIWRRS